MAIKRVNPYLMFEGTAAKALALYESALGAKVEHVMRFGDMPGNKQPPETKDLVMHAIFRLGPDVVMVSDGEPGSKVPSESNTHVTLDFDDVADLTQKFEALAVGGRVAVPPQPMFWGAYFGMLTDAYGIKWMFNCDTKKA